MRRWTTTSLAIVLSVMALGFPLLTAQAQTGGQVDPALRRQVETALRRDMEDARSMNGQAARLQVQSVDLNGDGRADAIVLMDHPFSCGSRGCAVHVFVSEGSGLRRVGDILANEVKPATTSTAGWRDLSVNGRRWIMQNGQYQLAR
jgi:hypothetical protein